MPSLGLIVANYDFANGNRIGCVRVRGLVQHSLHYQCSELWKKFYWQFHQPNWKWIENEDNYDLGRKILK